MIRRAFLLVTLVCLHATVAAAQETPSAPAGAGPDAIPDTLAEPVLDTLPDAVPDAVPAVIPDTVPARAQVRVLALGGFTLNPDRPHAAAGGMVHAEYAGWGVLGLGTLGRGGDYDSRLVGGALSRRLVASGAWRLTALVGGGHYRDVGWTGIERSSGGVLYGGTIGWYGGRVSVLAAVTDFRGSYDGDDVLEPFGFNVARASVAVGLTAIR